MRSERGAARVLGACPVCGMHLALAVIVAFALPLRAWAAEPESAATCAACHGESGLGVAPAYPSLAGQQAEYLEKQLVDFATGRRTNDAMTAALAQVRRGDFPILVAYYSAQAPAPARSGDVASAAGRELFEQGDWAAGIPPCGSCHGEHGAGSERYPRLAGQNPEYTRQQLADFKTGTRHNDARRMMRAIASRLSDAQMKALAEYLAAL